MRAILYEVFSSIREGMESEEMTDRHLKSSEKLFLRFTKLILDEDHISRKLESYAEQLCVTSKYLSHICRIECGKTATAIINEVMTERIRYYLEFTDLTIKEIASELDFPNLSFFGKYVKKHLGKSPKHYRNAIES